MRLRYATPTDLSFILEGLANNRAIEGRPARTPEEERAIGESFSKEIEAKRIRVVDDGTEAVAFLCFKLDFEVMYVSGDFLWVDLVYVRADQRGRGLGRLLYEDAARLAAENGCSKVVADVFEANEGSTEFHRSLGYTPLYTIFEREV